VSIEVRIQIVYPPEKLAAGFAITFGGFFCGVASLAALNSVLAIECSKLVSIV